MHIVRPVAVTDAVLTASNVPETPTLWSAATTYGLGALVYVIVANVHQGYTSLQAANLNRPPASNPTWWAATGPTNRWAMFDEVSNSLTTNPTSIAVTLALPATERADTVWLAGLAGRTVRLQLTDPAAGAVYDQTISLSDPAGVTDWYAWLFEAVTYKEELLITNLPNGAGSTLTVTVNFPGGTAAVGNLIAGFRKFIGLTRWGVQTEIRDYSVFADDAFGNRVLIQRAYRRLASGQLLVENRFKDAVEALLIDCRASLRLYIFDEGYTTLSVFGLARWATEMSLPLNYSVNSIQIEGNA